MKAKVLAILLALCMLTVVLGACGQAASSSTPASEPAAPASSAAPADSGDAAAYDPRAYEGTQLTVLRHSGYDADWMQEQFAEFTELTGIEVVMEQVAYSDLHGKIVVDLSSGGGSYDIIATPDFWLPEFAVGGWLYDLRQSIDNPVAYDPEFDIDDIPASLQDACSMDGQLLALPWKFNSTILYYRTDLMDAPPATWDEFLQIMEDNKDAAVKGAGMSTSKTALTDVYTSMLVAFGGELLNEAMDECLLDSQEALDALNLLIKLNAAGVDGSLNRHWDETAVLLAQGQTMMEIMVNTQVDNVTNPEKSEHPDDIGFAALPKQETRGAFMNTWALAVTQNCAEPDAGYMLLQFLMSKEKLADLLEKTNGGIAPSRTSLLTDPQYTEQYPLLLAMNETAEEGAWPAPKTQHWSTISEIVATNVQNALTGTATPEDALAAAKAEIDALF